MIDSVCFRCAFTLLAPSLLFAAGAVAQDDLGPSGVRGRVVIASEIANATEWPISPERLDAARGAYRIRRPSGGTPRMHPTEPAPELMVVLEGVKGSNPPERKVTVTGRRFVPGQILVPQPAKLLVQNEQTMPITVLSDTGKELATIEPSKSAEVVVDAGVHLIRVKEFPFATATVRTLKRAQVLPIGANGFIPPTPLPGGEYRLAFYHGAEPLLVRPLPVPGTAYIAIDASISKNRVVTVSIKDGDLKVLVPRRPRRVVPPPPAPSPSVEPETD